MKWNGKRSANRKSGRQQNHNKKRSTRRKHKQTLRLERLEDRNLLAGDVGSFELVLPPDFDLRAATELRQNTQVHGPRASMDHDRGSQLRFHENQRHDSNRGGHSDETEVDLVAEGEVRSIDGTGNNVENPELGSTHVPLLNTTTVEYADGISEPAGADRPSAREISNTIAAQTTTEVNDRGLTDITWLFGQFIDHDLDLSEGDGETESFDIEVPEGDIFFDPFGTGEEVITLSRSPTVEGTGTSTDNPALQVNDITAFLDGSVIYGSDQERADELRTFEGGLLEVSEGDLLPFNEAGLDNAGGTGDTLFLAGDIRANENAALLAMHTLWVREHNYWAGELAAEDPSLTDEEIYQEAKAIVTAELQVITYNEFLPALLGEDVISEYSGYDSSVDPSIANVFSTAAYRFGHSMLSTELLRLNNDGTTAEEGNLSLADAFFSPDEISDNGIDSLLLGATSQIANEIDNQVVDDIRNFLFGPPGAGGFDLASLNIQRGRDHGLADYNQVREDMGLDRVTSFGEISSDPNVAANLEALYGDVDNIDVWVGGLAEDHVDGGSLGELFTTIIADQFERIRDGDRFWYENVFSVSELDQLESTTLADILERNTDIVGLQENVFFDAAMQPEDSGDQMINEGHHGDRDHGETRTDRNSGRNSDRGRNSNDRNRASNDRNRDSNNRGRHTQSMVIDRAFASFDSFDGFESEANNQRSQRGRRS